MCSQRINPLISIIVPVYNTEQFIAETIESVIEQSYSNWELWLIDDGSTDNSAKVIKSIAEKDNRINYVHKENGGQASARNLGIKKANGEYIAFLDSDDLWLKDKLEEQIEILNRLNPDFLYGLGYYFYMDRDDPIEPYNWITGQFTGNEFFDVLFVNVE